LSMPNAATSEKEPAPVNLSGRIAEFAVVSSIVLVVSLILWWRFLPLPHQDLNFYTEPAFMLAKFGKLAGPGSQYVDLTYQKGIYNYPPGHFLILAAWIRLWGFSADSLLAYTHAVHAGILIILWVLSRFRYGCSRLISSLVLLSIFPRMAHGRPDLPACFLSVAAWLALPEEKNLGRLILSGCLAGITMLVSPGYGVGLLATLVVLVLATQRIPLRERLRTLMIWLFSAGLVFTSILTTVLYLQHSWTLAFVQFRTNAAIRGAQVNVLPDFHLLFTLIFSVIPFLLLAVIPAFLAVLATWRSPEHQLRNVSLAFLGGASAWFAMNKSQLLLDHHYLFPAKSIFVGVFYSWPRFPAWVRAAPLLLLSAIGFYYYKADFLYLTTPLRDAERTYAARVHPAGEIAVDSLYITKFYAPGRTLNYETVDAEEYWPKYLAAIPANLQDDLLSGLQRKPAEPSMLVVSAYTVQRFGQLLHLSPPCTVPLEVSERLRLLGRTWNLPAQPYALLVCARTAR